MLTLEQLFPTKLFETDPDQVQKILAQLPKDCVTYAFINGNNYPEMILRTNAGIQVTYYVSRGQIYTNGYMIPHDKVTAIACVPTPVRSGYPELILRAHTATHSSVEWYPGWDSRLDAIDFQTKQRCALDAIRWDIAAWALVQPCKKVLKGVILQGPFLYRLDQVKNKYISVYGKKGEKFRKVAIKASNARERFIVWLRRTDSVWHGVPIDICRMIARMCRVWSPTA